MSSFRPGPVPAGLQVKKVDWPTFSPSRQPAAATFQPLGKSPPAESAHVTHGGGSHDLNDARLQAAQILSEAAAEAEKALEAGFQQGRQEGIAAGKEELEMLRTQAQLEAENARLQATNTRQQAEADAKLIRANAEREAQEIIMAAKEEARRIIDDGRFEVQKRIDQSGAALVDLAVAAAMRVVQGHLALQPQSIVGMVAAGLRRLKDTDCSVRINPEDLPLIEAQRSTLERELGAGTLHVSPDPSLQRGSYMVTSPQGQIDGTLDEQAQRIQAALNAALGGNKS